MTQLHLVRHGTTPGTRAAAFPRTNGAVPAPGCEDLDRSAVDRVRALQPALPPDAITWTSHARRAASTAEVLGLVGSATADLAECDFGAWAGRSPSEIALTDAEGLEAWYADPDAAPHGGERLADVRKRAGAVLDRAAALGRPLVAVTHGGFIKAALLEVLGLPSLAVWRLDIAPASVTELHHSHGSWRVVRTNWTPA